MTPPDLKALLAQVEAAHGPDRELDLALGLAIGGWEVGPDEDFGGMYLHVDHVLCAWPASPGCTYPALTESLDAALVLVELVLPGAEYEISTLYGIAEVGLPLNMSEDIGSEGRARRKDGNVPLAVIEALLRALIVQQDKGGEG